jgi:hypothetical protein
VLAEAFVNKEVVDIAPVQPSRGVNEIGGVDNPAWLGGMVYGTNCSFSANNQCFPMYQGDTVSADNAARSEHWYKAVRISTFLYEGFAVFDRRKLP